MKRKIHFLILLAGFFPFAALFLGPSALTGTAEGSDEPRREKGQRTLTPEELRWINEARSLILDCYVDEVDDRSLVYSALDGMVSSLDTYCTFYSPEEEQRYHEDTKGEYVGIGLELDPHSSMALVLYPFPYSPAEKAGLKPGDRIIEIDGIAAAGRTRTEVEDLLRGPPDSICILVVAPGDNGSDNGSRRRLEIERKRVAENTAFNPCLVNDELGIAYMRIRSFNNGTANEVIRAVRRLKQEGARSLILDLRFIMGGLLNSALHTANLFQGDGILLRTRGRGADSNRTFTATSKRHLFPDIPLVLLVSRYTASAAEVLAGTLQDHERAVLVGERTFGKGVVQSAFSRDFGGEVIIKLTTARYYTPLGRCIETRRDRQLTGGSGLEPDFTWNLSRRSSDSLKRFLRSREVPEAYFDEVLGEEAGRLCSDGQFLAAVRILEGKKIFSPLPGNR